MTIYKRGRGFELGTTENKSSTSPERDSNPGLPDYESDTLTTSSSVKENLIQLGKPLLGIAQELFDLAFLQYEELCRSKRVLSSAVVCIILEHKKAISNSCFNIQSYHFHLSTAVPFYVSYP